MMNNIQEEYDLACTKMIEETQFKGHSLAKLTRDNIAIVEAMIRNDSAYLRGSDKNAAPVLDRKGNVKYGGSTAYWMTCLKNFLFHNVRDKSYTVIIQEAIGAVDRENSTHLNADGVGRDEIRDRIVQMDSDELVNCLKFPDYKDLLLIRVISKRTSAAKRARCNPSFASKFCHYACFYLFEGTEYQDNYSIYDSILKKVLPLYLDYYEIATTKYDLNDYSQYRSAVDEIRNHCDQNISRNGFDHLLWYYHKGRM